jgi:NADH-ubiquinone oxidoreductase chain 6
MTNLFVLNETFTNGLNYSVINFISFTSILCGIFVIISKNPIVSVLFLIGLFLNIASYLMMLGMNFIGLSYLLVYVGAVSILFLFILMLINIRISELTSDSSNSIPLAVIIGIFFNITLYRLLPSNMLSPNIFFLDKKFAGIMPEEFLSFDFFTSTTYSVKNYMRVFLNSDLSFVSSQV